VKGRVTEQVADNVLIKSQQGKAKKELLFVNKKVAKKL